MTAAKIELLAKITAKNIGAQPKKNSLTEGESKRLAIVFGRATKFEVIPNPTYGDSTKFKGSFEAQNLETNVTYKSSAAFLPKLLEGMLIEAIEGSDGQAVDFSFILGVKHSEVPMGYEYTVEPLTQPKESDELAALRQSALAALPAPAKEAPEASAGETEATSKRKK